jgi:hypothetical protein
MTRRTLLAATVLLTALTLPAQEKGAWRASSKSAKSITGDVAFSNDKISLNFATFPAAQIRTLTPAEIAAAFDGAAGGAGNLFRVDIPAARHIVSKNSLCGSDDTQWVVTYVLGKTLQIDLFSGSDIPALTPEAMANPTNLCGTFTYTR